MVTAGVGHIQGCARQFWLMIFARKVWILLFLKIDMAIFFLDAHHDLIVFRGTFGCSADTYQTGACGLFQISL